MDQSILASLFNLVGKSDFLDSLIILFASYWEYAVVLSLIAYLLNSRKENLSEDRSRISKKKAAENAGWAIASALLARLVFVNIIRFFYAKDRPFVFEEFTPLLDHAASSSFPSGHATFFMALAIYFLLVKEKKLGWFLFASAVLISVARVSAGIHWPSDILAGWALGFLVSLSIYYLLGKRSENKKNTS